MRRLALALVAALALAGVADARPHKKRHKTLRGHVTQLARGGIPKAPAIGPRAPAAPAPSSSPAPGTGTPPPPPPPPAPTAGTGRSVQARTDDRTPAQLKLVLSRATVLAGDVRVEFNNTFAEDPHDLLVERVDGAGAAYAFDELGPGEVQRRTLALDAGEWRLRCTLPTHAARGMTATLTVSPGG